MSAVGFYFESNENTQAPTQDIIINIIIILQFVYAKKNTNKQTK